MNLPEIEDSTRRVLVIGGMDTGKSTLAGEMAVALAREGDAALVDADVGQSHLGPPTACAWGLVGTEPAWETSVAGLAFVGSNSPVGHLLQLTSAVARLVSDAAEDGRRVVVDTPGLVAGPAARALWWAVIELARPDVVVAVEREGECGHILGGLPTAGPPEVVRLGVPEGVRAKSREERIAHRAACYRRYFEGANALEIDLGSTAVRDLRRARGLTAEDGGLIVGLRDARGRDLALGLVERAPGPGGAALEVTTPLGDAGQLAAVVAGSIAVHRGAGWVDGPRP
jgi:polynucleotide 5'-kinase involved in rRNA processing